MATAFSMVLVGYTEGGWQIAIRSLLASSGPEKGRFRSKVEKMYNILKINNEVSNV